MRKFTIPGAVLATIAVIAIFWPLTAKFEPPAIPETVNDVEVREVLTTAREKAIRNPASAEAWGKLGMLFGAHALIDEARTCYARAATLAPNDFRWPYFIGTFDLVHSPDHAVPQLRLAFEKVKGTKDRSAVRLRLAEALMEQQQIDEASQLVASELAEFPDNPRAHYNAGLIALERDQSQVAVDHFERCRQSNYGRKQASIAVANAYRRLGNEAKADEAAKLAAGLPSDPLWADDPILEVMMLETGQRLKLAQVDILRRKKQYRKAIAILEEMLPKHPDESIRITLGYTLADAGEFDRAIAVLREVTTKNPANGQARFFLGVTLVGKAEATRTKSLWDEAIIELQHAIEQNYDPGLASFYIANANMNLDRMPEAIAAVRRAIQYRPEMIDAHLGLADLLGRTGDKVGAKQAVQKASQLAPTDARVQEFERRYGKE